jgi:hypothetical protein
MSGLAKASDAHNLNLSVLPWKGDELIAWVFWGSLAGLISIVLAVTGIFRYLFPIWTLIVSVFMVRGFILGPFTYTGKDHFYAVLALIAGALGAFLSSLTVFKKARR